MTVCAALLLLGLGALAHGQQMPGAADPRRRALAKRGGWLLLVVSAILACAAIGWRGLMIWCGLVPVAAAGAMLAQALVRSRQARPRGDASNRTRP